MYHLITPVGATGGGQPTEIAGLRPGRPVALAPGMTRHRLARKPAARTLQSLLDESAVRLPLERSLGLARGVVQAVASLHAAGTLLEGLSPAGVELRDDGGVTVRGGSSTSRAPELLAGRAPTVASDIYAVGAVLFQLLTGLSLAQARGRSAVPRPGAVPAPSRFNPSLPDAFDALLPRMLASHPEDRPDSLRLVLAKLDAGLAELGLAPAPAHLTPPPFRAPPPALRRAPALDDAEDDGDLDGERAAPPSARVEAAWLLAAVGFSVMALAVALQ